MEKPTILLVDDSEMNLQVLAGYLRTYNSRLLFAGSGERALQIATNTKPDLILLDIMMPGIDGYETCKKLKEIKELEEIPVLFLSALDKVSDKVKGFESGGVDYISKPFQRDELIARVKTHIELYRIRRENARYAAEMEALAEKRAKALVHADRLATLGTLSAGVAHEINNPTTFISVSIQTVSKLWNDISEAIYFRKQHSPTNETRLDFILKSFPELISNIHNGISRIYKVVNSLKTYAHAGISEKTLKNVNQCISDALTLTQNRVKYLNRVETILDESMVEIQIDSQQIEQVLVNLIINAADALENVSESCLYFKTTHTDDHVIIQVYDNGPGISDVNLSKIWDVFFTTKPADKGTGLGLSISKRIIEDHGGTITVANRQEGGACFTISLPLQGK